MSSPPPPSPPSPPPSPLQLPPLAIATQGVAALAPALMVPAWLAMFAHGLAPAGPLDPLAWHAHEMVWGYLAAVIAGFLLTAIPNWTGRLPVAGPALALLVALWLAGRLALLLLPYPVWAAAIDLAFLPVLLLAALREVQAACNTPGAPGASRVAKAWASAVTASASG